MKSACSLVLWLWAATIGLSEPAFEGRINATITQGDRHWDVSYTVTTNCLRIERVDANPPSPLNIVDLQTGEITLLFPHNRTFVRLQAATNPHITGPPQSGRPPDAALISMQMEKLEVKTNGQTTNLLGYTCIGCKITQRGESMEIWATDQLLPFQEWLQAQPHDFGYLSIERQWGELMKKRKLFPLLAVLRFNNSGETYRFEVKSISREITNNANRALFQTPGDYSEIRPLQF